MDKRTMSRLADTPLRRSRANLSTRTVHTPVINDDEAERRLSRLHNESAETPVTVTEKDGLLGCLKIFNENKINKSNAWNMSLIDNFFSLVGKHHKSMRDFQFIGTTLEASCKIYGLRVDSVHADVINMATGLGKLRLNNQQNADNEDDAPGGGGDDNGAGDTSQAEAAPLSAAAKRKAKRKNTARCTLVKNTATINAKLETYPLSEPTFAKLNSTIGDINSSKRLLNYVLSSVQSELKHRSNLPFWDAGEHPSCAATDAAMEAEADGASNGGSEAQIRLGGLGAICGADRDLVMRRELRGYRISDAPANMDNDDNDDSPPRPLLTDNPVLRQSHIDLAFDINADIEPIADQPAEYMETGFDNDELNEMDAEDVQAICAVRSLRRNVTALDDMRPVDSTSSQLEYSYRPLENISLFWAGPSYWKIHKPRRSSVLAAAANAAAAAGSAAIGGRQQPHARTERRKFKPIEFVPDDEFDDSMFISVRSAEAAKLRKINIYKRWDPKKLRLPTNLHLDRQRYDKYFYAPGLQVEWNKEPAHSVISQTAAYNYNNAEDREYCSNVQPDAADADGGGQVVPHLRSDDEEGGAGGGGDGGVGGDDGDHHHGDHDDGDEERNAGTPMHSQSVAVIGTEFVHGAPEKIEKFDIPFARRAKVVDMKQLKRCCLSLIDSQRAKCSGVEETRLPRSQQLNPRTNRMEDLLYKAGAATFRQTMCTLPQLLTTDQKAAVSTATAFYSILHLANEQQLDLITIDTEDFYIRQLTK